MLKPVATIELVFQDETSSTSAVVVNVPSTSSIAVIDAQASALASLIVPMTDAVLVRIRITYRVQLEADIGDAGSNPIVVAGIFIFSDEDSVNLGIVSMPAIKSSLLVHTGVTDGYGIDVLNSAVTDFIAQLIDMGATNPIGSNLINLEAAYRQSRV